MPEGILRPKFTRKYSEAMSVHKVAAGCFPDGSREADAQIPGFEKPRQTRRDRSQVKKLSELDERLPALSFPPEIVFQR